MNAPFREKEMLFLKMGAASIWFTTSLGVLHPHYRGIGSEFLHRLHLPSLLMWLACTGEFTLAVLILALPPRTWLWALQVGAVSAFTVILGALDPMLLVHPFGVLSKNAPFLALVTVTWLLGREGWSPRCLWLLRGGMALVWFTEGLFPKMLFQQPMELLVVSNSGLVSMEPDRFLFFLGAAQLVSGVCALFFRGKWLMVVLWAQVLALFLLPLLVSWSDPLLWVHPFGPLTKNIPIVFGTLMVIHRCRL